MGTTHSSELTFTTLAAPSIVTGEAAGVTQTTATLTALVNPNLSATTFHFEYGPERRPTAARRARARRSARTTPATDVTVPLSGLAPGTTYHFRIVATNANRDDRRRRPHLHDRAADRRAPTPTHVDVQEGLRQAERPMREAA